MPSFKIGDRSVGDGHATYFIANIAANHDGSLGRAKRLICLSAQAGADAARVHYFRAPQFSDNNGFHARGAKLSNRSTLRKSVYKVYEDASLLREWTNELKACCYEQRVEFLATPYDFEAANMLDDYVRVYRIGSADITWFEMLYHLAQKKKPLILSTAAASTTDIQRAVNALGRTKPPLALLQSNANYAGRAESFDHLHLNVLQSYRVKFPQAVVGLSDHAPGHSAVLGAVALGAKIVEKHFTDDNYRPGPGHAFSISMDSWAEMIECTRELERALGSTEKFVADNEGRVTERKNQWTVHRDILIEDLASRSSLGSLNEVLRSTARQELTRCLNQGYSIVETARQLGTSRGRVYRLAKKLGPWPWRTPDQPLQHEPGAQEETRSSRSRPPGDDPIPSH